MKELLTKSFWQGVKKAYYEALDGPPAEEPAARDTVAGKLEPSTTPETKTTPAASSDQHESLG